MGRKKKFIDKKTAHRFVLMHRSQQDPLYYKEGASKMILHPSDKATARALRKLGLGDALASDHYAPDGSILRQNIGTSVSSSGELREVDEIGLPVDGYDYRKHLAAIDGGGTFVSKTGSVVNSSEMVFRAKPASEEELAKAEALAALEEAEAAEEAEDDEDVGELEKPTASKGRLALPSEIFASERDMDRMLEAITLRPETMDEDLRVLLEEDEDEDKVKAYADGVDTLEDDFMAQLMEAEKNAGPDEGFDFDEHVARLMRQAEEEEEGDWGEEDLMDDVDRDAILAQIAAMRPQREVDQHFDIVLKEYDDDEIGELEHFTADRRVAGAVEVDSATVRQLLDSYWAEKRADDERHKEIGATEGNRAVRERQHKVVAASTAKQGAEVEGTESDASEEFDAKTMLSRFGYEDRPKEKWDCETIVSTYSVLDNHPKVISTASARRKSAKARQRALERAQRRAAGEQGGTQGDGSESESEGSDDGASRMTINAGERRDKAETAEEKKLRKRLIKEQKRMRRQEKKSSKEMFKEEQSKQKRFSMALKAAAAPPPGTSTFKF